MSEATKVRTITVDTLTGILDEMYMTSLKKPTHDSWKDWSQTVWKFNSALQDLGFEVILVYGVPGTGKSTGMRTLPHNTNIWFNADNKNPTWIGGKEEYGKKTNPRMPYHLIPRSYDDIISHIKQGLDKGMFEEERYAILTGHVETYKEGNDAKARLQIIGKMSNKMMIERKFESVFYSKVVMENNQPKYVLETQNNGFDTVRSPMGLFEPQIPNDYNLVINKLLEY